MVMKHPKITLERAWTILSILIICLVIMCYQIHNYRQAFINPANIPERIDCLGRTYQRSNYPRSVYFDINSLYLLDKRGLYSEYPRGQYDPTVIYLKIDNNAFIGYALFGGP